MQIFGDNQYVVGIEYRDEETGEPREGSFIIPDESEGARKILEGYDFTVSNGAVVLGQSGAEKQERERRAQVRAKIRELLDKPSYTSADRDEAIRLLLRVVNRAIRDEDL